MKMKMIRLNYDSRELCANILTIYSGTDYIVLYYMYFLHIHLQAIQLHSMKNSLHFSVDLQIQLPCVS